MPDHHDLTNEGPKARVQLPGPWTRRRPRIEVAARGLYRACPVKRLSTMADGEQVATGEAEERADGEVA